MTGRPLNFILHLNTFEGNYLWQQIDFSDNVNARELLIFDSKD